MIREVSHVCICVFYYSKFSLTSEYLGTNAVIVKRIHCTFINCANMSIRCCFFFSFFFPLFCFFKLYNIMCPLIKPSSVRQPNDMQERYFIQTHAVLQIRRGNRDNLGKISHISP